MEPEPSLSAGNAAVARSNAGVEPATALRAAAVMAAAGALVTALGLRSEMGEALNLAPLFALAFAGVVLGWITVYFWIDCAFVRAREGRPFRSSREAWTLTGAAAALALPMAAVGALFTGSLLFRLASAHASVAAAAGVGVVVMLLLALGWGAVAGWRARRALELSSDVGGGESSSAERASARRPGWREAATWLWIAALVASFQVALLPVRGVALLVVPVAETVSGTALWLLGRRLRWFFLIALGLWAGAGTVHRLVYAPPELYRLLLGFLPWVVTTTAWCVAFFLLLRDDVSRTARLSARLLLALQLGSSFLMSLGLVN